MSYRERLSSEEVDKAEVFIRDHYPVKSEVTLAVLQKIRETAKSSQLWQTPRNWATKLALEHWIDRSKKIASVDGILLGSVPETHLPAMLEAIGEFEKEENVVDRFPTSEKLRLLTMAEAVTVKNLMYSGQYSLAARHANNLKEIIDFAQSIH